MKWDYAVLVRNHVHRWRWWCRWWWWWSLWERERVAVTTLDGISIARSYGFLCLHYHALFHTTTAGCFDCFSSSCRVKCLPCRLRSDSPVVLGRRVGCVLLQMLTTGPWRCARRSRVRVLVPCEGSTSGVLLLVWCWSLTGCKWYVLRA